MRETVITEICRQKNGPFFKANLHCHTTLSDGHMTAQQVPGAHRLSGMMIPTRCWNILGKKLCMRNAV